MSNLHSSTARGCTGIIISDKNGVKDAQEQNPQLLSITMPSDIHTALIPILYTLPIQLLAYHTALLKGTDIDQPRNLAKSVTVE
jgi:glucosamine--fructose-6-phosphate aminotransferase (isomerizing)